MEWHKITVFIPGRGGDFITKLSEEIEAILHFFERCKTDYRWHEEQYIAEENRENTLRHELEGVGIEFRSPPKYKDRARLATDLQNALIARRMSKDFVTQYRSVVEFANSDLGKNAISQLKQKLGEVRKSESLMQNRVFFKRKTENGKPENKAAQKNLDQMIREWKRKTKSKH